MQIGVPKEIKDHEYRVSMVPAGVRALVDVGIPVMAHLGLTPQSVMLLGGYKAQGRTAAQAHRFYEAAVALERAGCFALVLEAVPPPVAARITDALGIPTIGIGAGPGQPIMCGS